MLIQFRQALRIHIKDDVRQLGNELCVIKSTGVITACRSKFMANVSKLLLQIKVEQK